MNAGVKINTNTIKKRPLKAFVRVDGSGRKVNASLIWRKSIPKVGRWMEVDVDQCCGLTTTTTSTTIIYNN